MPVGNGVEWVHETSSWLDMWLADWRANVEDQSVRMIRCCCTEQAGSVGRPLEQSVEEAALLGSGKRHSRTPCRIECKHQLIPTSDEKSVEGETSVDFQGVLDRSAAQDFRYFWASTLVVGGCEDAVVGGLC